MLQLPRRRIHGAERVRVRLPARRFVVNRPAWIPLVNPVRICRKVRALTGFIAQRPDDHGRMILVAFNHADGPVQVRVGPVGISGQRPRAETHSVAFDVGFVEQVNAVAITKIVPGLLIRIMGAADGIDVELLHQLNVALHESRRDRLAAVRINFVSVRALDQNALSVHEQIAVANFNFPEADVARNDLQRLSRSIFEREKKFVQVRRLRRPLQRIGNFRGNRRLSAAAVRVHIHFDVRPGNGFPARIEQCTFHRDRSGFGACVLHRDRKSQSRILVVRVEVGLCLEIANVQLWRRPEINIAENSAHPPHVLVFEIGSVAPPEIFHGDEVLPRLQVFGDVKFHRRAAVLAHADFFAVDPEIEKRIHAVERQEHSPPGPLPGNLE